MRYQSILGNCNETTVSGLVSQCPETSTVFELIGVNPTQHSDDTIVEAAQRGGVEPAKLCQQLFDVYMEHKPLETLETDVLLKIVAEQYQAVHLDQLPKLHRLARKIEAVHRDAVEVPRGVTRVVKQLQQAVVDHSHTDDTQGVTPVNPDHEEIRAQLRELRALTDRYHAPDAACRSWRKLYSDLQSLDFSLSEQIYLEQNILLPRFRL